MSQASSGLQHNQWESLVQYGERHTHMHAPLTVTVRHTPQSQWFGPPYNAWYVGKIVELNRRRTRSENVSVEITNAEEGTTRSLMVADPGLMVPPNFGAFSNPSQ